MNTDIQVRYENLRKSVNDAIKKLCGKIEQISKDVGEIKEDHQKLEKKTSKQCNCMKSNENFQKRITKVEENIGSILTDIESKSMEKKSIIENIEGEIDFIKQSQEDNKRKIENINEKLEDLH